MSTLRATLAIAIAAVLGGCKTNAYCFSDCDAGAMETTSSGSGAGGSGCLLGCSSSSGSTSPSGAGGGVDAGCVPTNNGVEICDGLDNDCNGKIDDIEGLDVTSPTTCGSCDHNCRTLPGSNWDSASVTCTASADAGQTSRLCHGTCVPDYWDLDHDPEGLCETYCVKTASDDKTCDGRDDNCNGQIDEDVPLCTSITDCGYCGHACTVKNGTPQCVHTGTVPACDASNTHCAVLDCTCTAPGNCYWDADGKYENGCEYKCDKTNGGVEICDGIDNDCDGIVDDNLADPAVGVTCSGGPLGVCADPAHAGVTQCLGGVVVCTGAHVITPGQNQETCNGLDDDCDGQIDNNPTDTGPSFLCGASGTLPCRKGTLQCQKGQRVCVGNIDPQPETCDGVDNDCDGVIDDNLPAAQNGAPCNAPTPPPAGATTPCKAGATHCQNGAAVCLGTVLPVPGAVDGCGVDANCDGKLQNQPDLMTDVNNCGSCGHACKSAQDHATWSCVGGSCVFGGCQTGYYDIPANHTCSYPCIFTSSQELCNGVDDNCDGNIDEGVVAPSPVSVCGVGVGATTAECSLASAANPGGVNVACVSGKWKCTFGTPGVCSPTCSAAAEKCDGKDNNCNGLVDENVPNVGQPCASDQGRPPPGDGACRTIGTYICDPADATKSKAICTATKDLTKAGPELCDGIDNDCDGLVDEPFTNKGTNAAFFVKPTVTKIQASPALWIHTYEASRPSATNITAGTGNGYVTTAPAGTTLDATPACSVSGKIPWFNVTGDEVDQTCIAAGGHTCSPAEWMIGCTAKTQTCTWAYGAAGSGCTSGFVAGTKFCNLGMSYDFDPATPGLQNGLLPTASSNLASCFSDWTGALGNVAGTNDRIFDMTGNLREITKAATNQYTLLGGAFDTAAEEGATCGFSFYNVDSTLKLFDTGFRCCFSSDPTQ